MCAIRRFAFLIGALVAATLCPSVAGASCAPGATPDFGDVVAVDALRFSLVGAPRPAFSLYAGRVDPVRNGRKDVQYDAGFKVLKKGLVLAPGLYTTADAKALFDRVVALLKQHEFFAMHLAPAKAMYIDGPEDYVAVSRCGSLTAVGAALPMSRTSLGSLMRGVDVDDPQWAQLQKLLDDLQALALAGRWTLQPAPAPGT